MIIYFLRHASAGEPLSNLRETKSARLTKLESSNAAMWDAR